MSKRTGIVAAVVLVLVIVAIGVGTSTLSASDDEFLVTPENAALDDSEFMYLLEKLPISKFDIPGIHTVEKYKALHSGGDCDIDRRVYDSGLVQLRCEHIVPVPSGYVAQEFMAIMSEGKYIASGVGLKLNPKSGNMINQQDEYCANVVKVTEGLFERPADTYDEFDGGSRLKFGWRMGHQYIYEITYYSSSNKLLCSLSRTL